MTGLANWVSRPVGTIVVKSRTVRRPSGARVTRQERFIKVSHHGTPRERWRPFARHWWLQNVGPIPEGFRVYHRDGDSLNDEPTNLVLIRQERFAIQFAADEQAARRSRANRARAVASSNRLRGSVRAALLDEASWYAVIPSLRLIVMIPIAGQRRAESVLPSRIAQHFDLGQDEWFIASGAEISANDQPERLLHEFRRFVPTE